MPAKIVAKNVDWHEPVKLKFGFMGLDEIDAIHIVRRIVNESFPETVTYTKQCLYVIRLRGAVAIAYGDKFSPVLYIGEGNAKNRLYGHANWLARLLLSVPNLELEIQIAEVKRPNHTDLCEYVEADMIKWFRDEYRFLPWFNQQRERSKEDCYEYDPEVESKLKRLLGPGSGNSFVWAIKPTHNNSDAWEPYEKNSND
jgi:hypothetical protein